MATNNSDIEKDTYPVANKPNKIKLLSSYPVVGPCYVSYKLFDEQESNLTPAHLFLQATI